MKNLLNNRYLILLFRLILGITFIYASIHKIADPLAFSDNISNFHITPISIDNLIALILPWIELFIGIGLMTGVFLEGSATITIGYGFFIILLVQALIRGVDTHCGCFKSTPAPGVEDFQFALIKQTILDFFLLGMAIIVKLKPTKK